MSESQFNLGKQIGELTAEVLALRDADREAAAVIQQVSDRLAAVEKTQEAMMALLTSMQKKYDDIQPQVRDLMTAKTRVIYAAAAATTILAPVGAIIVTFWADIWDVLRYIWNKH